MQRDKRVIPREVGRKLLDPVETAETDNRAMPNIGDVVKARDIGYSGRALMEYRACPTCGKEKWEYLNQPPRKCWNCGAKEREATRIPETYSGSGTPKEGDIARASTLGYKGRANHVFYPCSKCGTLRWTPLCHKYELCPKCVALGLHTEDKSGRWKGGIKKSRGYVYIKIAEDDPMFVMVHGEDRKRKVIAEHRLVVARVLGRPLTNEEVVHHINGIKDDNRPENLRVMHYQQHHSGLVAQELREELIKLQARVTFLEAENARINAILSGVQDSDSPDSLNISRYNTPAVQEDLPESIVRAFSNEGDNEPKSG